MSEADTSQTKPEKKPDGRTKEAKRIAALEEQVNNLTGCLARMAHQSGSDQIVRSFGLPVFVPGKDDMRKYKG